MDWTHDTVRVLHKSNGGKGTAVRAGLEIAEGDLVMVHDADAEYDPTDIPRLLEPLLLGQADVSTGPASAANATRCIGRSTSS